MQKIDDVINKIQNIDITQMDDELKLQGWDNIKLGYHKTTIQGKSTISQYKGFRVYVRQRKIEEFFNNSSNQKSGNPSKINVSGTGSTQNMGVPNTTLTPSCYSISHFDNYPSLLAARPDKPCILIGYDSEWQNLDSGERYMLSWQFAVVVNDFVIEMCFIRCGSDTSLNFSRALACLFGYLQLRSVDARKIRRYDYCSHFSNGEPVVETTADYSDACHKCVYVYKPKDIDRGTDACFLPTLIEDMPDRYSKRADRDWAFFHSRLDFSGVQSIPVCIVCHAGKVDLSGFEYNSVGYLLRCLNDVQGGLVSLQPTRMHIRDTTRSAANNEYYYPVSLSIADTMCHAPAGLKKLKNLGDAVGVPKYDIPDSQKDNMVDLLADDPVTYFEYASTDGIVTLMYSSALYGLNNQPPVTVTSATASVMKGVMMDYLGCSNTDDFNRLYRGLERVSHGNFKFRERPGYTVAKSLEPISDKANTVQYYSSQAYHGGYNSCSEVGYFPFDTFDYDLRNAYPTAMCLVADVDWENPVKFQVQNRDLDIRDFMVGSIVYPIAPFVCYCTFEFPDSVKYPCIPVNVDGIPVYPRTSTGMCGVYVAGPYVYLALRLGAHIHCETGYFLNTLLHDDYPESRCLSSAVIQLVRDRNKAVADCGKKSLEELILKTMVNSGYGKTAQNVVEKSSWSAFRDCMEDLGCSSITNPVSAMMITSIVQCVLLAAQNQIHELGYMSCSVTTDGFISNCPADVLDSLDLYDFRRFMSQSRLFLTDGADPCLWETKHHQNDLVNFCTRGNVSLLPYGVCAHNSAKSGFEPDSYEDRLWLMCSVISRTGVIECEDTEWTSFKTLVTSGGDVDFSVKNKVRHLHMDYDLKRKPIRDSFRTDYPVINGFTYPNAGIAHFDTEPYNDIAEFRLYRRKKKGFDCLRTESEWQAFFLKVDTDCCGIVKDLNWSIITSIIMGYRSEKWDIPALNGLTVAEKCEWINKHNDSGKKFKPSDWKNCRRPERICNMLPIHFLEDKLQEMINDV